MSQRSRLICRAILVFERIGAAQIFVRPFKNLGISIASRLITYNS